MTEKRLLFLYARARLCYNRRVKYVIYGGTFNPPHPQHIAIARHALDCGYDKVVLLPSGVPPHKSCFVGAEHRLQMLRIAARGERDMLIDEYELTAGGGVNYTSDVLPVMLKKYPGAHYLIGGDSLIDLHKWHEPEKIIKMCPFLVCRRAGRDEEFEKALDFWRTKGAEISVMDYYPEDISSTLARWRAELGDYRDLDEQVAEYIKKHDLYDDYADIIDRLSLMVKPARLAHCKRTCECAVMLNIKLRLGLDNEKVFLAGLLHDCGKGSSVFDLNKAKKPLPPDADEEDRQSVARPEPFDLALIPADAVGKPVEHQFVGAVLAERVFGVRDKEILDGVRYHCTGKAEMSVMEKLIFCADVLEEGRDYPGVERLRSLISADFEEGFRACLKASYDNVRKKGGEMYPLTAQAYEYYFGK